MKLTLRGLAKGTGKAAAIYLAVELLAGAILLLLRIICERAKINLIDSRLFEACQLIYQCFQGVAVRVCFLTEDFGPGDCSFNCHFDRFLSQLF